MQNQFIGLINFLILHPSHIHISDDAENIILGTTRWVAEDQTGDTIGLANLVGDISLCATQLSFKGSQYASLRKYEEGFVKEGVGAGASAITAHLLGLENQQLLALIEIILSGLYATTNS